MQDEVHGKMTFEKLLETTGIRLSEEQERAVRSDRAAVVSAGAGSGKTTVLSLRFVRLVLEQKAHSDQILTLTFTEKAAAEMYDRIHSLLSLAAAEDADVEEDLKLHFPDARISTMDSFWGEIARTDSLRYGMTRDFSLLDDDALEEIIERIADELEGEEGWMELSEHYQRKDILGHLLDVSRKTSFLTKFSAEENLASYDLIAEELKAMAFKQMDDIFPVLEEMIGSLKSKSATAESLRSGLREAEDAYLRSDYLAMDPLKGAGRLRNKPLADFIKESYTPVREKLQSLHGLEDNRDYVKAVSVLISKLLERLGSEKRKAGMLTYSDTEALAKEILLSNRKVRNWYKDRFSYIMVDEFQDNNASQRDLLYLLSEKKGLFSPSIPDPEDLDPMKLFFVGDEKQSIYFFRGADVSVFRSLSEDVGKMGGESLSLRRNYRSEPSLISHFNKVFQEVFTSDEDSDGKAEEAMLSRVSGIQAVSYEAVYEDITSRPAKDVKPSIKLAVLEKPGKDEDLSGMLSADESEALFISEKIKAMVLGKDPEYLLPGGKAPRYRDIAVLVRNSSTQLPLERIFRVTGIPYVVLESSASTLDGPCSDLYSFLNLLLFPEDRLSYIALLRSPFARLSDKALLGYADKDWGEGFEAFAEDPELEDERDRDAYGSLKELYLECRELCGRVPVSELVSRIWHKSGYQAWLDSREDLRGFEEHYRYLWAIAEKFDRDGKGLSLYLDYLRPLVGHPEKIKDVSLQHFSSDSVQIMTIHKSKGLQFPVVIIPDLDHGAGGSGAAVSSLKGQHPYLMVSPGGADPVKDLLDRYAKRRELAERKRVLYVAATRAETHLLVTASRKRGLGLLNVYLKGVAAPDEAIERSNVRIYFLQDRAADISFYGKPVYERGSLGSVRIGVRDYAENDNSMLPGPLLPPLPVDGLVSEHKLYTAFGVMVHEALEAKLGGFTPCFSIAEGVTDEEEKELEACALSIAEGFPGSGFYKTYVEGRRTETEVRFYYPEEGKVLEGVADLIAFGEDRLTIIDYKTDRRRNPEQHRGQLENYAKALSEIYGKPCGAVLCYVRDFSEGIIL